MKQYDGATKFGEFFLPNTINPLVGQVHINGSRTNLEMYSKEFFHLLEVNKKHIHGILNDKEKISLIDCLTSEIPGSGSRGGESYYFSDIFPHYIAFGNYHLDPDQQAIVELSFLIEDASNLFYDFDAFGTILKDDYDGQLLLRDISQKRKRPFHVGEHPEIFYYTGKYEIFSSDTCWGRISASHQPSWSMPSPNGISMKNLIPMRIEFERPQTFKEAIDKFYILLGFTETVLGVSQNVDRLHISTEEGKENHDHLEIYWCMHPEYKEHLSERRPHPADVLINGGMSPDSFSIVLANWLKNQQSRQDSRGRFIQSFAHQGSYSIDRLSQSCSQLEAWTCLWRF